MSVGDPLALDVHLNKDQIYNTDEVNRWELFLDRSASVSKVDDPRTLQITYYSVHGEAIQESVYEDASEADKRPRLLVSLESVLSLKALCEREFDRVEVITNILKLCRTAYFKELQYLRQQLKRTTKPDYQPDGLENYEVYWYDPPEYIDADMRVFLQDCIRLTNKKLIEENFELVQKLKALGEGDKGGDDADILRMIRTLGPGGFVRKLYGFLCTPEHGSQQKRKDFEIAVLDLLKKDGSESEDDNGKLEAKIRKLQNQIDKLQKQVAESDALRKRVADLEEQLARAQEGGAKAAMEAARADAEKARADEMEAQALKLQAELNAMRQEMQDRENALKEGVVKLAMRTDTAVKMLDRNAKPAVATPDGPLGPMEASVSALESCVPGLLSKLKSSGGADPKEVAELTAQLKASQESEAKLKAEIAKLQAECKRLKAERDAEAANAAKALAQLEALRAKGDGVSNEELEALRRELRDLREANERLSKEIEDIGQNNQRIKDLELELAKAHADLKRLKDQLKGDGGLAAAEEALMEMQQRLQKAHDKIIDLKAIIRKLKAQMGIEDDDDDLSDDSNYDGDMPLFLMSYTKRTRTTVKPRWKHLSEDARFGRQKRDFLFAQAHADDENTLGQEAAAVALDFLRETEDNRSKRKGDLILPPQKATHVRSPSKVFKNEQEPVHVAIAARQNVVAQMGHILGNQHVQDVSARTGHGAYKFESLMTGQAGTSEPRPTLEACLQFSDKGQQRKKQPLPRQGSAETAPRAATAGSPVLRGAAGAYPPMVVTSEAPRPLVPLQGGKPASASLQAFHKAREQNIGGIAGQAAPRPLSQSPERSSSPTRAVSRAVVPEYTQVPQLASTQTRSATDPMPQTVRIASPQPAPSRQAVAQLQRSVATPQPRVVSPSPSGNVVGMVVSGSRNMPATSSPSIDSGQQTSSSDARARQIGQLEAIAASRPQFVQQDRELQISPDSGWSRLPVGGPASSAPTSSSQQPHEMPGPNSPTSEAQRPRSGGLLKMETPTEWSVESHRRSPSPTRAADDSGRPSSPVAVQRLSPKASRPTSPEGSQSPPSPSQRRKLASPGRPSSQQGSLSPERSQPSSPAARAAPPEAKEVVWPSTFPPTIADMVAHPQSKARAAGVTEGFEVPLSAMQSEKSAWRSMADPLEAGPSTSSVGSGRADPLKGGPSTSSMGSGTLPMQDSTTSTAGSLSSLHHRATGSKQGARGRALNSSAGFRAAAGSSNGFGAGGGKTAPSRGGFAPEGLGFGDRPSGSAQMSQSSSSWHTAAPEEGLDGILRRAAAAEGAPQMSQSCSSWRPARMEGASPPPNRSRTAGGPRDVVWGCSRSTNSLPLTNMPGARNTSGGGAHAGSPSPMRLHKKAKAELAAANSEGHLPELLPAFKPGKIHKGPKPPSWLLPL